MNITDIIRERVSVRTFDNERQLSDKEISAINQPIADATSPFGGTFFRSPDIPDHKGFFPAVSFKLL